MIRLIREFATVNIFTENTACVSFFCFSTSVLNTWPGRPEEQWNPATSTVLQVNRKWRDLCIPPKGRSYALHQRLRDAVAHSCIVCV